MDKVLLFKVSQSHVGNILRDVVACCWPIRALG